GGGYSLEVLADDAAALIGELGLAPCHFVGLSMGGFVGIRLAARRPELIRSLVLVDSAGDAEPRLNVPKYAAMEMITRIFWRRILLGSIMNFMSGRSFLLDSARAAERRELAERLLAPDEERLRWALDAVVMRDSVEALLGRIQAPTMVVWGTEDMAIVRRRARQTAYQ